ncbi:hypothetical protein [Micromonospora sp. WMMD710]|uniref:hypothetical protein n=1 Tax=Micromonospora sp. WMMD710 TaxID=3016085 RepID=UPI0024169E63|nr:hypothetical protein [Micromonospora sp. WMMD710]MDG4760405.1 hypothetical protein [Micromonospora sp. WMMD710]
MAGKRRRIYTTLLEDPTRTWTVRELAAMVDTPPEGTSEGTVRDTFNVLLADGHLRQVPHRRSLTAMLTDRGQQELTNLLRNAT